MPVLKYPQKKEVIADEITGLVCNKCGKESIRTEYHKYDFQWGLHRIEIGGGYGDNYPADMSWIKFVLCEDCLLALTASFMYPPDESNGMYGKLTYATHSETGARWTCRGMEAFSGDTDPDPDSEEWDRMLHEATEAAGDASIPDEGPYLHYKGKHYQVLGIKISKDAPHEILVHYQALYAPYQVFLRPLTSWVSRTADGQERFAKVNLK